MVTHKQCTVCHERKPLDEFHKRKTGKYGRVTHCKRCESIRKREYYLQNRDERIAYAQQWRKRNPKKARAATRRRYHKARREKIEAIRKAIKR